jgi:hypothetical protein
MIRVVRISMIIRMRSGLSTSASSGPSPEGTSQAAPSRRAAGSSQGPSATASRHAPMSIFRAPPGAALAFRASAFRQGGIRHPRVGILRDPQQDPLETRLGRIGAAGDSLSCSLLQSNDPTRVPVAASTTTERPDSSHTRIVGPLLSSGLYLTRVPVSRIRSASTTPMRLVGSAIRSAACAEIVRPPGVTLVPSHCRAANSASNLTSADEGCGDSTSDVQAFSGPDGWPYSLGPSASPASTCRAASAPRTRPSPGASTG